ncbi:MAG TPA: DUF4097 family beta strand repeat-containing protein [Kofleriaceae bacterium]|nr:DUF4097 family beta strand repeat-containing protein [Kofleriaceae bacterium]
MSRVLAIAVLLAAVVPAAADPKAPVVEKSRVEVKPAGKPFKQLQIDNPLGNVKIEGHDGSGIMIETHKSAPDDETLDRLRVSLVPDPDGTVRIVTAADPSPEAHPQPRSAVSVDIIIHAPRDARIDASVGSGKLEVINMDGGGELDSASGAISVKNVSGELYTHSLSGRMTLTQVFGPLDAATVSSDLDLDTIGGDRLVASANQGKIAGRRVRARDVELTTMSGNISLEGESTLRGHIVVSSLHGDVDVRLRRHGALLVKARGTKVDFGSAKSQLLSNGWAQSTIGQGQDPAIVELHSQHGIVRFAIVQ